MRTRMINIYKWICLLPAVAVAGKHKTILFTVTCVMITIVQKIVISRSTRDRGRNFSCRLSSCSSSVIPPRSCTYGKYLTSSDSNFLYLLLEETLELYSVLVLTSSIHKQLISSTEGTNVFASGKEIKRINLGKDTAGYLSLASLLL